MTAATRSKSTTKKTTTADAAEAALEAVKDTAPASPEIRSKADMRARAEEKLGTTNWVYVPEWDSAVTIKPLTAGQHEETIDFAVDPETDEHSQLRQSLKTIELGCVDPTFTEDDHDWLRVCQPTTLHILVTGISILTGLRGGEIEALQRRFP